MANGWKTLSTGAGWVYNSPQLLLYVLEVDGVATERSRDIPDYGEFEAQDEAEEGLPLHVYNKWVNQGWWPKLVRRKVWKISAILRTEPRVSLESDEKYAERWRTGQDARREAEEIIPRLEARKRPAWMKVDDDGEVGRAQRTASLIAG